MPTGFIGPFGGSTAPAGWHLCDGSAHGSAALEAVLGSATTPDLRGKFVIAADTTYPAASEGGEATHTLTIPEMPAHWHDPSVLIDGAVRLAWGATVANGIDHAVLSTSTSGGNLVLTGTAGDGVAHNNMPPYYSLTYIIKT